MRFWSRTLLEWFVAGFGVVLIMSAITIGPVVSMLTEPKDITLKEVNVVEVQEAQNTKLSYDRCVNLEDIRQRTASQILERHSLYLSTSSRQDSITVDLSEMKGSPVAMVAEPITNKLVLYPYTNGFCSRYVLSVDGVVKQLREQGDMTNLVKNLVESGDVCAVVGHKWERTPHVTLEYRPDGNYPAHRKCALCGKAETLEPGAWK